MVLDLKHADSRALDEPFVRCLAAFNWLTNVLATPLPSPVKIDHDTDGYLIHRDYTTSARLNSYLQTGKMQFYVRYLGDTYEMTIKKPEPVK